MNELEAIKTLIQLGEGAIFLWLFLRLDARLEKQTAQHDQDIARLYDQRIQDLKILTRTTTNLEGV